MEEELPAARPDADELNAGNEAHVEVVSAVVDPVDENVEAASGEEVNVDEGVVLRYGNTERHSVIDPCMIDLTSHIVGSNKLATYPDVPSVEAEVVNPAHLQVQEVVGSSA